MIAAAEHPHLKGRPTPDEWQHWLQRGLAYGAALLLGAGLIFFLAYNWDALHRFAKFALAAFALLGCAGFATTAPGPDTTQWRAALFGAAVVSGALLALIGQSYQTGADMWMLFALWCVLITPFALLSRASASWLLWLLVFNLAVLRALSQSVPWPIIGVPSDVTALLMLSLANAAVLAVFERAPDGGHRGGAWLLLRPGRILPRVAALGTLLPLGIGAITGLWDNDYQVLIAVYLLATALSLTGYLVWRRDLVLVALNAYGLLAFATFALLRVLPGNSFVGHNLTALFVVLASAGVGFWLRTLHCGPAAPAQPVRPRHARPQEPAQLAHPEPDALHPALPEPAYPPVRPEPVEGHSPSPTQPWWLMLLQSLAAWVASLLILGSFLLPLAFAGDSPLFRGIAGAVLCIAAIALFRRHAMFTDQMALAFSLAGQALLSIALADASPRASLSGQAWAIGASLIALGMMLAPANRAHRIICALIVLVSAGLFIGNQPALPLACVLLTALACGLWLYRDAWMNGSAQRAHLLSALAVAATLLALAAPAILSLLEEHYWVRRVLLAGPDRELIWHTGLYPLGVALVLAWSGRYLLPEMLGPEHRHRLLLTFLGVLLLIALQAAPGLLVSTGLMLLCLRAAHRALAGIALLAVLSYLGLHYYQLHATLLHKSVLLAAGGVVLLALRSLIARPTGGPTTRTPATP